MRPIRLARGPPVSVRLRIAVRKPKNKQFLRLVGAAPLALVLWPLL